MLAVRGIAKSYGVVKAVSDVSFEVGEGEIVSLAGENGSGKSTLARIISGALQPDAGTVLLDGEEQSFSGPGDALNAGIAMVTQELTAVPRLSVGENVMLTRLTRPFSWFRRRWLDEAAQPVLESVALDCDPRTPFAGLKAGDRELVEIAKALAAKPRYLILDEATSRLGEADVARLFALLRRLREQGVSILIITHRIAEIVDIADRAVVLRDGRYVGELEGGEITESRLSTMMVGRQLVDLFHKPNVSPGDPVIEVEDLVFDTAKDPISFQVRAGEAVGIAGLVGAGRTELLETIAGVRPPKSGKVFVDGEKLPPGSPRAALKRGVALLPEDRHAQGLVLGAPVCENLAMCTWRPFSRARRSFERSLSRELVERLGIRTASIDVPVRTLSGGNQQKVVLGRCLNTKPRVLLMDEPTRGIDVGAKEEVFQMIAGLLEEGLALIFVSSDMLEVLGVCDRILVLQERKLAGEVARRDATEEIIVSLAAGNGRIHEMEAQTG